MNILAKKIELVQLILHINKPSLLNKISQLLILEKEEDWWDELPADLRESIEIGLEQAESGNLIPHESVMNEINAKYKLK
ncbi:MAG: hypothetical protein GQ525_07065 [Draconibacterium sp.]|nr:hypothetical protein [Draconibacterium sp.]